MVNEYHYNHPVISKLKVGVVLCHLIFTSELYREGWLPVATVPAMN